MHTALYFQSHAWGASKAGREVWQGATLVPHRVTSGPTLAATIGFKFQLWLSPHSLGSTLPESSL